ncbi:2OG-Fe(II) oxygenase [Comamonas flocculans]|uniref:2-oxoglutarate-dependent dioxygenase n=1 Tax=Comamonas flocculans TaxID=2597701 RepID=A0A5B8RRN7_9BURK|nr:2OG-Fe(II) oxygenase [Comamonas flocculans]QEA12201.1 2-oxoglutarate-dependent dioxygenase [Comamonas flocculans]
MSASQSITDELRAWIIAQAGAGVSAPALIGAMRKVGWSEDVAVDAIEQVLRSHVDDAARTQGWPPAVPVPEPALDDAPLYIDLGDRQVQVLMTLASPRVVLFGGLLSPEECDALIAAARPRLKRSLTVRLDTGDGEVNQERTSDGMFFERGETPVISAIEERIARLLNWPVRNGEGLQVLNYQPGAEYKPHYDYFDPQQPGTAAILARGGQRVGTLVIYLNDPAKGGATIFPDVHLEVAPCRGNAVFFSYERPHPSTRSLHGGTPVIAGEKWIATKWLREREFR